MANGWKSNTRMMTMRMLQYICDTCGKEVERPASAPVPKCHGKMRRKYYPVNVVYKGDGFTGAQKEER